MSVAQAAIVRYAASTVSKSECSDDPPEGAGRLGQSKHSPSGENDVAKQDYQRRPLVACILTQNAGILNHAFAVFLMPSQRTALNVKA
jgi:hypothetical protein